MNFSGKNVLVYGLGRSGVAAVDLLLSKNANVFVYEDTKSAGTFANDFRVKRISSLEDVQSKNIFLCVVSPGVQIVGNKTIKQLKAWQIEIIPEVELGAMFVQGDLIAITGTNGKTTSVMLLKNLLQKKYDVTFMCGNIGFPISSICNLTNAKSATVVEVSSFMLETTKNFKPKIACILNISPDHLTRHKTYKNYIKTKFNIKNNFDENNVLILNKNIKNIFVGIRKKYKKRIFKLKIIKNPLKKLKNKYKIIFFDINNSVKNNKLYFNNKKILLLKKCKLKGEKNYENILNDLYVCSVLGLNLTKLKKEIYKFSPPKHRIEFVAKKLGRYFFDDSKATNPDSTICALSGAKKPVVVLLGGSDKGFCFDEIFDKCQNKIKKVIAFGAVADKIVATCKKHNFKNVVEYKKLEYAIGNILAETQKNDIVLLSPANASFDEFTSFEHRGEMFATWVKNLQQK